MKKIKSWANRLKQQIMVLYFAYKHNKTPWYAKIIAICVVAYAFSPIDLIPDFIHVLGFVDDVILLPLGISLALKATPKNILKECENHVKNLGENKKPKSWITGIIILLIWGFIILWLSVELYHYIYGRSI